MTHHRSPAHRKSGVGGGWGSWCKIGRYWWERGLISRQKHPSNAIISPSPPSSHHVTMETQIDTWPGPGPSIPTTALLGSLSSPSLRTIPVVLGVVMLLLTLRILESCLSAYCFLFFDLFKQDQKFYEIQTTFLIRMRREIKILSPLVRAAIWKQTERSAYVNSSLFWDLRRRRFVVVYRRFGTTYRSYMQGSDSLNCLTLEDKTAETSVTSYQPTPRNIPEGQRPQIQDCGSLRSWKCLCVCPSGEQNASNMIEQRFPNFLTRGALFRINFYGGAP